MSVCFTVCRFDSRLNLCSTRCTSQHVRQATSGNPIRLHHIAFHCASVKNGRGRFCLLRKRQILFKISSSSSLCLSLSFAPVEGPQAAGSRMQFHLNYRTLAVTQSTIAHTHTHNPTRYIKYEKSYFREPKRTQHTQLESPNSPNRHTTAAIRTRDVCLYVFVC